MRKYSKKDIFGLCSFIGIAIALVFLIFMSETVYDVIIISCLLLMHIIFFLIHISLSRIGEDIDIDID